jgi:outer membrane protein assembly factor BamB
MANAIRKYMRRSVIAAAAILLSVSQTSAAEPEDSQKVELKWSKRLTQKQYIYVYPTVGSDGVVYYPLQWPPSEKEGPTQKFMAFNPDGSTKWEYTFEETDRVFFSSSALSPDGNTIYLWTRIKNDSFLLAISADKGAIKWRLKVGGRGFFWSRIAISDGNILHLVNKKGLYAVDGKKGEILWQYTTDKQPHLVDFSSPLLSSDGRSIYYIMYFLKDGEWSYSLASFDAGTGDILWQKEHAFLYLEREYDTLAIDSERGTMYLTSREKESPHGFVYAFNLDGTLKWKYKVKSGGDMSYTFPTVAEDGTIYITTGQAYEDASPGLIALDPKGRLKWRYEPAKTRIFQNPVTIGRDGNIYLLFDGEDKETNGLYCINSNGELIFKYHIEGTFWGFAPALSPDGTIYVVSEQGILYAIK